MEASIAAAGGLARPTKKSLSTTPIWVLKRASRRDAQAELINADAQPILPSEDKAQLNMTKAGARPNDTMSDRLSYCSPKALEVLVRRATRPSRPSRIIATNMATAALTNCPFMAEIMA